MSVWSSIELVKGANLVVQVVTHSCCGCFASTVSGESGSANIVLTNCSALFRRVDFWPEHPGLFTGEREMILRRDPVTVAVFVRDTAISPSDLLASTSAVGFLARPPKGVGLEIRTPCVLGFADFRAVVGGIENLAVFFGFLCGLCAPSPASVPVFRRFSRRASGQSLMSDAGELNGESGASKEFLGGSKTLDSCVGRVSDATLFFFGFGVGRSVVESWSLVVDLVRPEPTTDVGVIIWVGRPL